VEVITVEKTKLRAAVQKNRDLHKAIFDEAVIGYKEEAVRLLEAHIERIKAGKVGYVAVSLPMPVNHTRDYDRILAILDMEVAQIIELTEDEFAKYVQDDWSWKREFIGTAQTYNSSTGLKIDLSSLK
jgi:hypothetical protein